jgi:hypothetical protein
MKAVEYFLAQHAWGHAAAVSGAAEGTTIDRLLEGLTDQQVRSVPAGLTNSIAWIIWHMARIEDVTINVFVAEQEQLIVSGGWAERLGVGGIDIGTGMGDVEVADLGSRIDLSTLMLYRAAVGRQTRSLAMALRPSDLDRVIVPERVRKLRNDGIIRDAAEYLLPAWEGQTVGFVLRMPASAHNFVHVGEAWCVRALQGAGSGR